MLNMYVSLVFLLVILGVRGYDHHTNDPEWKSFKFNYNKTYGSTDEEMLRYSVFKQNTKLINDHNEAANSGVHSYWVDINHLTDMTHEEYLTKMQGLVVDNEDLQEAMLYEDLYSSEESDELFELPDEVDWRTSGCITPVKYQGHCGGCYAFSTTGALEFQHCKKTGKLVSLSEQNIIDCTRNSIYQDHGCTGGNMDHAFEYIINNNGIDTEKSYPYNAAATEKCRYNPDNKGATMVSFTDVLPRGDEQQLKLAVATVGPVSVGIDAYDVMFKFYSFGIYDNMFCSSIKLDHAVLAVGYGTENGADYWLLKNSWSTMWGIKGYMKMVRNKDNRCGIASMASYPIV